MEKIYISTNYICTPFLNVRVCMCTYTQIIKFLTNHLTACLSSPVQGLGGGSYRTSRQARHFLPFKHMLWPDISHAPGYLVARLKKAPLLLTIKEF